MRRGFRAGTQSLSQTAALTAWSCFCSWWLRLAFASTCASKDTIFSSFMASVVVSADSFLPSKILYFLKNTKI